MLICKVLIMSLTNYESTWIYNTGGVVNPSRKSYPTHEFTFTAKHTSSSDSWPSTVVL